MARPLRIEFPGAFYHVTARGDRREAIYEDDSDRECFLSLLGDVVERFAWLCHGYCLMDNHYHLIIETPHGNLSGGMRHLNGVFTQYSNRRHRRVGHLFQGRYKAILVDSDAYLMRLSRYVVRNPVRAGVVGLPGDWPWSSYRAMAGEGDRQPWLTHDLTWRLLAADGERASARYREFVLAPDGAQPIWPELRQQIYLGDDKFIERMQGQIANSVHAPGVNVAQQRPPVSSLEAIMAHCGDDRDSAILTAYATGGYSYTQIAAELGVHLTTVGRVVRRSREGE